MKTSILWLKISILVNVPQARPIENFWAILVQKVYEGGWEATSEEQLIRRIKAKIREFNIFFYQRLMRGINEKLKNIAEKGVFSYLSKWFFVI